MKKVLKSIVVVFAFVFVVFGVTGCGEDKGLVGTWVYESGSGYIYTFNEDKTCAYEMAGAKMECTYEDDGTKVTILYKGNTDASTYEYKIDGDTLTIKDSLGKDVIYKR